MIDIIVFVLFSWSVGMAITFMDQYSAKFEYNSFKIVCWPIVLFFRIKQDFNEWKKVR